MNTRQGLSLQQRKRLMKMYGFLYHRISGVDWGTCLYCGEPRCSFDHVPPVSLLESMNIRLFKEAGGQFILIPSCTSCNSILKTNPEMDINSRKTFIAEVLEKRIKKTPYWTEYELSQLGHSLRTLVINKRNKYEVLYSRLINLNILFEPKAIY